LRRPFLKSLWGQSGRLRRSCRPDQQDLSNRSDPLRQMLLLRRSGQ
jgi:hypothetical protein